MLQKSFRILMWWLFPYKLLVCCHQNLNEHIFPKLSAFPVTKKCKVTKIWENKCVLCILPIIEYKYKNTCSICGYFNRANSHQLCVKLQLPWFLAFFFKYLCIYIYLTKINKIYIIYCYFVKSFKLNLKVYRIVLKRTT